MSTEVLAWEKHKAGKVNVAMMVRKKRFIGVQNEEMRVLKVSTNSPLNLITTVIVFCDVVALLVVSLFPVEPKSPAKPPMIPPPTEALLESL